MHSKMIHPARLETLQVPMEINFVTGKGGVGKSAVAAALALKKARQGLRTILVELGDQSYFQDYFSLANVGYHPQSLQLAGTQMDLALWSGQDCLKEYALHILKIESLYRLFFENAVSKALVNVAPALPELAILGKVTSGPPRNVGPKMPYDVIVVDAYASGHFMALINAPAGLSAVVRFGPMGEQVRDIDAVLRDKNQCHFHVVALPEELPVVEGLELAQNIDRAIGQKPQLWLNRMISFSSDLQKDLEKNSHSPFGRYLAEARQRQQEFSQRLAQSGYRTRSLPWIFSTEAQLIVEKMSEELS